MGRAVKQSVEWRSKLKTLFVDNIGLNSSRGSLYKLFSGFGCVMDVFIPSKVRPGLDHRFGFVRYKSDTEAERAVKAGNGRLLDGRRLFIKWADYVQASSGNGRGLGVRKGSSSLGRHTDSINRSFADVVKQRDAPARDVHSGEVPRTHSSLNLSIDAGLEGWLQSCSVGHVRPRVLADFLSGRHQCWDISCGLRPMGGKSFFIVFPSPEAKRSCLSENSKWFEHWFEQVSDCDKLCVSDERLSWIKCRGLPVAAWTEENLKSLAALWGDFVLMHSDSKEKRFLDVVQFMVVTRNPMIRDDRVSIFVDGREFIVHCEEESVMWKAWDKINHHLVGPLVKSLHAHAEFPILDIPGGRKLVGNVEGGSTPFEAAGKLRGAPWKTLFGVKERWVRRTVRRELLT